MKTKYIIGFSIIAINFSFNGPYVMAAAAEVGTTHDQSTHVYVTDFNLNCWEDGSCLSTEKGYFTPTRTPTMRQMVKYSRQLLGPDGTLHCFNRHNFKRECVQVIDQDNRSTVKFRFNPKNLRTSYSIRTTYCTSGICAEEIVD